MGGLRDPDGGGRDGELQGRRATGEGEGRRGILRRERQGDRAERHLMQARDGTA